MLCETLMPQERIQTQLYFKIKVRKTVRIRNLNNQVAHVFQDTKWVGNKITINVTNKSQEVSPFPSGDHKAAMNRRDSMKTQDINNTNDPQKNYRLGTVSKNYFT